jgi:hypothetical protein
LIDINYGGFVMGGIRTNSGANLNRKWQVGASHALYRENGRFYMPLERFPGAYFDTQGYLLFHTEGEYQSCEYLTVGIRVNVKGGISAVPGYVRVC